jgi:hypothetical protein
VVDGAAGALDEGSAVLGGTGVGLAGGASSHRAVVAPVNRSTTATTIINEVLDTFIGISIT